MAAATNTVDEADNEGMEMKESFVPGYSTPEAYFQTVLKKMVECTQKANGIASSADDYEFWSSYPEYNQFCMEEAGKIRRKIVEILHHECVPCRWKDTKESPLSTGDIEEKFEQLVEANDALLERVDLMLDEAAGFRKDHKPIMSPHLAQGKPLVVSAWNKKVEKSKNFKLLLAKNIQRPQLKWMETVDNKNTPFVPILREKPNALKPWKPAPESSSYLDDFIQQQRLGTDENIFDSKHPYEYELGVFEPADWQLKEKEPQGYKPLEEVECTFIDTVEGLNELSTTLKKQKEFAIDLEAHSYRSFLGFVCLMQISTRESDYLVDTIELRKDLQILNESFTDPNILKVMHGADMDIGWLQRDFGLYIVNLFDTGQAARILGLGRFSLAFLLYKYCNISADKQYQLADWRMRPIPEEMIKYAREDTHYLLYIKDKMRNELLRAGNGKDNILQSLYSKSTAVAGKTYQKPIFTQDSYQHPITKYRKPLNKQQLQCFKLLYAWRDQVAREEDESTGYVLPNHMILSISEILPREPQGIIACCNPVPPIVKQRTQEIHALVEEAKNFDFSLINEESTLLQRVQPYAANQEEGKSTRKITLPGQKRRQNSRGLPGGNEQGFKNGFELYPVTGPKVESLMPSISLFYNVDITEHNPSPDEKKAALILASFRSPFELHMKNVEQSSKSPLEINKKWKDTSKIPTTPEQEIKISGKPVNSNANEDKKDTEKLAKRPLNDEDRTDDEDENVVSLRDLLPSKKKIKKKGTKQQLPMEYSSPDTGSGTESPVVALSYEKTKKARSFVPFDYSETDLKKFSAKKTSAVKKYDTNKGLEEPKKKAGSQKSRVYSKAGEKSLIYKN